MRSWSGAYGWLIAAALILVVVFTACFLYTAPALAYMETTDAPYPVPLGHGDPVNGSDYYTCLSCHGGSPDDWAKDCAQCHGYMQSPTPATYGKGPHNGYSTGSVRCAICHMTHTAGSTLLLPQTTITATCEMCHDGTGGRGVYGAIQAQTGSAPGAQHRVDQTNLVPGGSESTGATSTLSLSGPGNTLSCGDCHSPHNSNTVAPFPGDRRRVPYSTAENEAWQQTESNRLLVTNPGHAASAPVAEYGADWCIACHKGRMAGAPSYVANHPGDSGPGAFTYGNVAKLSQDASTTTTVMGPLGGDSRGYLMPYRSTAPTRTAQQVGHSPICQQCHEDSRFAGTVSGEEASASLFAASIDGTNTGGNPRFQNFPHEAQNVHLLVETNDDLCLNCHPSD